MATENPVYQVLVTSGNQAVLAKDQPISALKNGQVGVFNYHTGLSVDGTVTGDCRDIVIAVGINRTSGGTANMEDYRKSSGQLIQVRNMKALSLKGHVNATEKVVDIAGFSAMCETEYLLKIEFKSQATYGVNGYNQFAKTYSYYSGCCPQSSSYYSGCIDCAPPLGNPVDVANGLVKAINADPDQLVTAKIYGNKLSATIGPAGGPTGDGTVVIGVGTETFNVAVLDADTQATVAGKVAAAINAQAGSGYKATVSGNVVTAYPVKGVSSPTAQITLVSAGPTGVTVSGATNVNTDITDADAFAAQYPGAGANIRLTGNAEVRPAANGGINPLYHKTGTNFDVSLIAGLNECNGVVTVVTELQYPEGKGYDLQQMEYEAAGWNGSPGPYRQSAVLGLGSPNFEYFVSASGTYNQVNLIYDQFSVGGWQEYLNNLMTVIAIPCADSTTLTGLATILSAIFNQFGSIADDAAAMTCTSQRTGLLTYATDGIESLG